MAAPKCKYRDWFPPVIKSLRWEGKTVEEIAAHLHIHQATLMRWAYGAVVPITQDQQKELCEALKENKQLMLSNAMIGLATRSTGYKTIKRKVIKSRVILDNGEVQEIIERIEETEEEVPPETAACNSIMNNLGGWKSPIRHEMTGKDGQAIKVEKEVDPENLTDEDLNIIIEEGKRRCANTTENAQ